MVEQLLLLGRRTGQQLLGQNVEMGGDRKLPCRDTGRCSETRQRVGFSSRNLNRSYVCVSLSIYLSFSFFPPFICWIHGTPRCSLFPFVCDLFLDRCGPLSCVAAPACGLAGHVSPACLGGRLAGQYPFGRVCTALCVKWCHDAGGMH